MKKLITKRKVSITIDIDIYNYVDMNFENKSKYIECLIYQDVKKCGKLKNNIIL